MISRTWYSSHVNYPGLSFHMQRYYSSRAKARRYHDLLDIIVFYCHSSL